MLLGVFASCGLEVLAVSAFGFGAACFVVGGLVWGTVPAIGYAGASSEGAYLLGPCHHVHRLSLASLVSVHAKPDRRC